MSEAIGYGIGVKPECPVPENLELPGDLKRLMDEQRTIQRSRPPDQRVYIGGEIQIHHLMQAGFHIYPLGRFEDFEEDAITMFNAFLQKR